jgi:hypothetical protein
MSLDTASEPSNASLSVRDAAALFEAPEPEQGQPEAQASDPAKAEPAKAPEATQADANPEKAEDAQQTEDDGATITIEVDGKAVEVKKSDLPDLYKNGLRQADYTRKTMEAAEQRKTADAEANKAREQRQQMAQGLQQNHALLVAALQEQDKIDWDALIQQDPQEYLKQKHLYDRRQAALQDTLAKSRQLGAAEQQERVKHLSDTVEREQQELLAKLPEWKDEKKAAADKQGIVQELLARGFEAERIFGKPFPDGTPNPDAPGLTDHKILLLVRDAMLYRKTMEKAKTAAQKVSNLPQKVERPGGGETNPLDGRTTAIKQLNKSGSVRDAAAVFDRIFN